ncbi:MAG TPA: hypothetical protein VGE40_02740 [Bacilli bacterium]
MKFTYLMDSKSRIVVLLTLLILLPPASPSTANAAYFELTAQVKTSFDKVKAAAESTQAGRMDVLYKDLLSIQQQDQQWDAKIPLLHYANEDTLIQLNKATRLIDADKISQLEAQVKQTRERYKPLFALYTSLNQQITAARTLKNKKLNSALRTQADGMKFTVQLARQDIRNKESLLKTAKGIKAKTVKKVHETLAGIATVKVQIKVERSAINLPKTQISLEWRNFNHALKQNDVHSTLHSMTSLLLLSRQIVEQKKRIYNLEVKVKDILLKAKSQFP